ncbi:family 78 glycoside hydrolase catalytic domain [Robiginitalea sp. M366]|uniref:family 78 glycoside hydrolase catalytic domain n=1 Tax=Robiginitalea aestuariiviva TaxID=3036903 RepID=UPI00240E5C7C|nr:family 78 glycoside hydrolase catalytic domain [Robiginitalea aestuariiviva]MDG1573338.1 family 78 glycoside hydrolase catalytic domain [Robiginitalea aestuariiviva]
MSIFRLPTFLIAATLICFGISARGQLQVTGLQTEYLTTPLGLDEIAPRFSWRMEDPQQGHDHYQEAYRIRVADANGQEVWDSGRVTDAESVLIPYTGAAVQPFTRYGWALSVWTRDGQELRADSWFETGLLDPDPESNRWAGAQWIGAGPEALQLYSHYLSVFQLELGLQLDQASGSTRAAFVFGANDMRLMHRDYNIQGVQQGRNQSYLALELDISGLQTEGGHAKLHLYRVGYAPGDDPEEPFKSLEVPQGLVNASNQYEPHTLYLKSNFGILQLFVDGTSPDNEVGVDGPRSPYAPPGFNVNPVGSGNNFISFPMVADIGFWMRPGQQAIVTEYAIRHFREPANLLFSKAHDFGGIFNPALGPGAVLQPEGIRLSGQAEGLLIAADPSHHAAPILRTAFRTPDKPIRSARLYATARGIYEAHLNGERVGEAWFTPGLTQYNRHQQYQTYDLTGQIRQNAENVLGSWLGEGWWAGNITYSGENWNYFGDRPSFRALLRITYEDGTESTLVTSPEQWDVYTEGPLRYGSYFQGEVYDARLESETAGWSQPGFDASAWGSAAAVPLAGTAYPGLDYDNMQMIGQIGDPPAIVRTLTAQSVQEVRPGVWVYDMGQNMVGVPEIDLSGGQAGDTLVLRYAEVRYPDLPEYEGQQGMVMLENIRAALTQDLVILKGGPQQVRPRFTFHGYRYLELSGVPQPPPLEAVRGRVVSSVPHLDSHFETSNPLVNRFWENITWSLRGNFLSIPTDTPARNERMGWSGDINVFSQAATYLATVAPFLQRHLLAMRDIQREDGRFTDVAPVGGGFGGTLWGSAGMILPWEVYRQYGDVRILEDHYPAMAAYLAFLESRTDTQTGILDEGPLGDWLSPEGSRNDNTLLWTAYQVRDLDIMTQAARLLGKPEDAARYASRAAERRAFFNSTYVDPETHQTRHSGVAGRLFGPPPPGYQPPQPGDLVDTQASYAIPLHFGVFAPEHREGAARHLEATVARENRDDLGVMRPAYSLMTGFIGTASLNHALSETGRHAQAYRLLQQEDYPSWLYPVRNGATTIWERLNSYTLEDGFGGNNSMNSFNHYSFGAVAAWMYNYALGIRRGEDGPGFRQFVLAPVPDPDGSMTFARGYYDSPYGRIESGWEIQDGAVVYTVVVPPNTTASLTLPARGLKQVRANGKRLKPRPGIREIRGGGGQVQMTLGSGRYVFQVMR